jgi:bifunctional DNase/RNase
MQDMIEMAVEGIGEVEGGGHVAVLRERGGDRTLGIGVGMYSALWISANLERAAGRRPNTYLLALHLISQLGGRLLRATIDTGSASGQSDPEAFLEVEGRHGVLEVGCALEDAVALASCGGAPILVHPDFLRPGRRRRTGGDAGAGGGTGSPPDHKQRRGKDGGEARDGGTGSRPRRP